MEIVYVQDNWQGDYADQLEREKQELLDWFDDAAERLEEEKRRMDEEDENE